MRPARATAGAGGHLVLDLVVRINVASDCGGRCAERGRVWVGSMKPPKNFCVTYVLLNFDPWFRDRNS